LLLSSAHPASRVHEPCERWSHASYWFDSGFWQFRRDHGRCVEATTLGSNSTNVANSQSASTNLANAQSGPVLRFGAVLPMKTCATV